MIRIDNPEMCCGCTACASICKHNAIVMKTDMQGFLYPQVNHILCIDCGLCDKVCPITHRDSMHGDYDKLRIFAVRNKNSDVQYKSSSGGIFSVLSDFVLGQGGYVVGAVYNSKMEVIHMITNDRDNALKFRGSKYVQSDMKDIYIKTKNMLTGGAVVLFSGTPCQIEGLKRFLGKTYENLITCDLVCHSVPSPQLFYQYISFVSKKYNKKIVDINMKDKTNGWGHQGICLYFEDGTNVRNRLITRLWNNIFYSHLVIRPSCFSCRFTNYNRPGDITIGDFWGIEKSHPDSFDKNGVSLLMLNSSKGKKIFDNIKGQCVYTPSDTQSCTQPQLSYPVKKPDAYNKFWSEYSSEPFKHLCSKYWGYTMKARLKDIIKAYGILIKSIFSNEPF